MEDFSVLSDKQLREKLLQFESNPPPVNANTRAVVEQALKRYYANNSTADASYKEMESSDVIPNHSNVESVTQPATPPTVRFETKPDTQHFYEREYTPSYCRKSLNEYRDKKYDSPKFNLIDKPGYTPHGKKHELMAKKAKSGFLTRILVFIIIFVMIVFGIYYLLNNWDPSYGNPMDSLSGIDENLK